MARPKKCTNKSRRDNRQGASLHLFSSNSGSMNTEISCNAFLVTVLHLLFSDVNSHQCIQNIDNALYTGESRSWKSPN